MKSINVNWGNSIVKLTWLQNFQAPRELITSAHGFCFFEDKLMLVDLHHRGWDFPGGHVEPGETPEEAFKREAMEEGYVEGDCVFLGAIEVNHHENPNWDKTSPYPIVGYQMFYRMDVRIMHDFKGGYESSRRIFKSPIKVEGYYRDWHDIYQAILDYALQKGES